MMKKLLLVAGGTVATLAVTAWLGLQVEPQSFPDYPARTPPLEKSPLPDDLPEPVARFYNVVTGGQVPTITSAVLTGRARLRFNGITFNARFRFIHAAGQDYRHYIEATVFGLPLLKVNEFYLDGKARMELPFATIADEPNVDQAANLGLWGESMWLPSLYVTDPRVRWEAIDSTHARLIVPFGEATDSFEVTFDPETGLIATMEAMRFREAGDTAKIRWMLEPRGWIAAHGVLIPSPAAVTWADEGTPWAIFTIEDATYNVDVTEALRRRGL